jgi:hypothetical protein
MELAIAVTKSVTSQPIDLRWPTANAEGTDPTGTTWDRPRGRRATFHLKIPWHGGNVDRMDDLGAPVGYPALPDDVPVYDRSGALVGRVAQVLADDVADILHGLVIRLSSLPPRFAFADPSQIDGLYEHAVVLLVDGDQLHDPSEDAVAAKAVGNDAIREGLRRAVEWISRPA